MGRERVARDARRRARQRMAQRPKMADWDESSLEDALFAAFIEGWSAAIIGGAT
jgi:hypothetical protein